VQRDINKAEGKQQCPAPTRNVLAYYSARILQKAGMASFTLALGARTRAAISNPPGILKSFVTSDGRKRFEADASLRALRFLVRSASSFWDIGANCGLYSLYAIEENPDLFVVSVEASTEHYRSLCANWLLQPSSQWLCIHSAIGDREAVSRFSRNLGALNHVVDDAGSTRSQLELRPMTTLDKLAGTLGVESLDVVKADVEGYELNVLRGATSLLEQRRIGALVLESDGHGQRYGTAEADIVHFLTERRYKLDHSLSQTGSEAGNCLVFIRA
jgi:FkbM family methyltransferase